MFLNTILFTRSVKDEEQVLKREVDWLFRQNKLRFSSRHWHELSS
jgi:hypothetical protein